MKTPDKIKKGLELHNTAGRCKECPYTADSEFRKTCFQLVAADALAYIEQLEAKCHQLERERDALLDALKKADMYGECANCCHRDSAPADCDCECGSCKRNCRCRECRDGDKWEWRGVKEDE